MVRQKTPLQAVLKLEDGSEFSGISFGADTSVSGEVVFNTGMVGYPETLTDPSYFGQILVFTYPLIGNYGVPHQNNTDALSRNFESSRFQAAGIIVNDYSQKPHHWNSTRTLGDWLKGYSIPGLTGIDTRALTKKLREQGTMLGKIAFRNEQIDLYDPNVDQLMPKVSIARPAVYGEGEKRVLLIDCGSKHNIINSLLSRGVSVKRVPWDHDVHTESFDGLLISNGPGDPKQCRKTILQIRDALSRQVPTFGICLGHQLMALAAGANTYKLEYGHRSQNQPVIEMGTNRCLITSQNHGFAVENSTLPSDWSPWFNNLNDGTNEGLRHDHLPFMSVQFHPEASPGPVDAGFLFDDFLKMMHT